MSDLGETSFVLRIIIVKDLAAHSRYLRDLVSYIDQFQHVPGKASIKGDKYSVCQSTKIDIEIRKGLKKTNYSLCICFLQFVACASFYSS